MCREISPGARVAARVCPAGFAPFAPRRKMTAAQKEGRAFERGAAAALTRALGDGRGAAPVFAGRWIEWRELATGRDGREVAGPVMLAQPDIFALPLPDAGLLLLEVKLTLHSAAIAEATRQLERLYGPLLSAIWPGVPQRWAIVGKRAGEREKGTARVWNAREVTLSEIEPGAPASSPGLPGAVRPPLLLSWDGRTDERVFRWD